MSSVATVGLGQKGLQEQVRSVLYSVRNAIFRMQQFNYVQKHDTNMNPSKWHNDLIFVILVPI